MIIGNMNDLDAIAMDHPSVKNASMKVLVSPNEGWAGHVMRAMELGPNGYTPKHEHPWPHINYIIEGEGTLLIGDTRHPLKPGGYAYVPEGTLHQFSNTSEKPFKFICIVPEEGHK